MNLTGRQLTKQSVALKQNLTDYRLHMEFDSATECVILSASIRSFNLKASGCPTKMGRIGKRVRIPRGRATVMRLLLTTFEVAKAANL